MADVHYGTMSPVLVFDRALRSDEVVKLHPKEKTRRLFRLRPRSVVPQPMTEERAFRILSTALQKAEDVEAQFAKNRGGE